MEIKNTRALQLLIISKVTTNDSTIVRILDLEIKSLSMLTKNRVSFDSGTVTKIMLVVGLPGGSDEHVAQLSIEVVHCILYNFK